jgi:hypothetical protein
MFRHFSVSKNCPEFSIRSEDIRHAPVFESDCRFVGKGGCTPAALGDTVDNDLLDSLNSSLPRDRNILGRDDSAANLLDVLPKLNGTVQGCWHLFASGRPWLRSFFLTYSL